MYAILLSVTLMFAPTPALATSHDTNRLPSISGHVRKVDKETGKITLKHDPIPNLDMPNMTMVFRVTDPAMLDKVKVGDHVRFTADKVNGMFTVTSVEVVK
jgi:Cu(I)/Ag(I) efflux system periplasmic protein CusF